MAQREFIDTNVIIYSQASDEPAKQVAALALMGRLHTSGTGVVSTQVLAEFCNVALKKLKLPALQVHRHLEFLSQYEVVQVTPEIIRAGLDLHQTRALSFYDAVIVASAASAGCAVLWSEDMNHGESVTGLRIHNPFAKNAQA